MFVMLSRLFIAALWSPAGKVLTSWLLFAIFMPPKELWEAYSNCTVRPSVHSSVRATDMDLGAFLVVWR